MLSDYRTWTSFLYLLLKLPLGIVYFTLATVLLACGVGFTGGALWSLVTGKPIDIQGWPWGEQFFHSTGGLMLLIVGGLAVLYLSLYVARGIGWLHGRLAEALLARP